MMANRSERYGATEFEKGPRYIPRYTAVAANSASADMIPTVVMLQRCCKSLSSGSSMANALPIKNGAALGTNERLWEKTSAFANNV